MSSEPALRFEGASKRYPLAERGHLIALHPTTVSVPQGSVTAVVGRSGSGKTTLLHLAAGIEAPDSGSVYAFGKDLARMSDRDRAVHRRDNVGLVFQFFRLLEHLTVEENVALPALIAGDLTRRRERARALLDRVGLLDRAGDSVDALSGGEMQRVAICRALLREPRLVLADEPTGNLDDTTNQAVMSLMFELVREQGATLVYATHSHEVAALADRRLTLSSGVLAAEAEAGGPADP